MKVAVGSTNKAKKAAVEKSLKMAGMKAEVAAFSVMSNVSEQPFSDEETRRGAMNRAENVLNEASADMGIGLEGGVMETAEGMFLCNWGALAVKDQPVMTAGGARILLPEEIANQLRHGAELGDVMEQYTAREGIRQQEGAIGVFTGGLVTREDMFLHITTLLIGQFMLKNQ